MNDNQTKLATNFLRVLQKNGGTENMDIVQNQLEELGIDIEENPIDFEIVEQYLFSNKIIKTDPETNYFYIALENLDEVLNTGIKEFVKQLEESKKQPQIIGHNIQFNSGTHSQGTIYESSLRPESKEMKTAENTTTNSVKSLAVNISATIIGGIILWLIVRFVMSSLFPV